MVKKGFESNPFYSSSILIQMNEEKKKMKLITLSRVINVHKLSRSNDK